MSTFPEPEPEMPPDLITPVLVLIDVLYGIETIGKRYLELTLKLSDTVGYVKTMIQEKTNIPVNKLRLISRGKQLQPDDKKLYEFGLELYKLKNTRGLIKLSIDFSSEPVSLPMVPEPEPETVPTTQDEVTKLLSDIDKLNGNLELKKATRNYLKKEGGHNLQEIEKDIASIEKNIRGLTDQLTLKVSGGGKRRRRGRRKPTKSRKTKQNRKRRSLKRRSLKRRSLKRRSLKRRSRK